MVKQNIIEYVRINESNTNVYICINYYGLKYFNYSHTMKPPWNLLIRLIRIIPRIIKKSNRKIFKILQINYFYWSPC